MFYIAESIKQYVNFGFLKSMSRQCGTVQRDLLPSSDESHMIIGTAHVLNKVLGLTPKEKKVIFYFTTGCHNQQGNGIPYKAKFINTYLLVVLVLAVDVSDLSSLK